VDYKKLDDEALMRLIALTQEQALGALYDRYSRLVYSMALNATGDSGLAEEITQDVFLRVWGKAETYKPEQGKVVTWMSSITRYRAIDLIRQRGIRPEGNRLDWAEDDDALNLPDSVNIESEVEVSQRRQRVHKALAQLPPEQRQALAYAFFQGYSHSQIAEALREPLGTVKTRIRLAMQKLRQILYEDNLIDE
jgi:RNA polymerase sigma-70 factor (ECF subfamily)